MAPIAVPITATVQAVTPASLKLRGGEPNGHTPNGQSHDADAVAGTSRLSGPLKYRGSLDDYPVRFHRLAVVTKFIPDLSIAL